MGSDADLLKDYLDARSQGAFRALVERHLGVVYGVALRRLGNDAHAAEDVAQEVFALLARKADALRDHPALAGWLYASANHLAHKHMRKVLRRAGREMAAIGQVEAEVPWNEIRPVIDDAMLALSERDRIAVLLRYFQGESFQAIGSELGLTESGARMRTEHALESLRGKLARRGVTSTGTAIGMALAAHGAAMAPGSLAAAITAGATAGAGASALLFMSTSTIKTGAVTAALLAGATGLFIQNRTNNALRSAVASLRSELLAANQRSLDGFRNTRVATQGYQSDNERLRAELARADTAPPPSPAMAAWAMRLASLKQRMADHPELSIPELSLLTEDDWLDASKGNLDSEEDYQKAMASLRNAAEAAFGLNYLQPALRQYSQEHKAFPENLSLLRPYLDEKIGPEILQRWEVMPTSAVPNIRMAGELMVTEKAPVDPERDSRLVVSTSGMRPGDWIARSSLDKAQPAVQAALAPLVSAYRAANAGQSPSAAAQLVPFATTPEQQTMLQQLSAGQP